MLAGHFRDTISIPGVFSQVIGRHSDTATIMDVLRPPAQLGFLAHVYGFERALRAPGTLCSLRALLSFLFTMGLSKMAPYTAISAL